MIPINKPLRAKRKAKGKQIGTRPKRESPMDGIERTELTDGHKRERCVTPEAMQNRREELYARSGSHCEGCRITIYLDTFHLHHFKGRGRGRCDCMECIQALCPDVQLLDSQTRFGCHTLQHQAIDINGKFDPNKSTRLGEKFQRPTTAYKSEFVI